MKSLDPTLFQGQLDGKALGLFELTNAQGFQVAITNYGARILQILTPDRWGGIDDVVLGYASLDATMAARSSVGAFIGRYAGRIGQAQFTLDGQLYRLHANDGPHCLHGGLEGLRFKALRVEQVQSDRLLMSYRFVDGEMGFPGELELKLEYRVTAQNALEISYEAHAIGKSSLASFAPHPYFNLNGSGSGSAMDHEVMVHSSQYVEVNESLVATGRLISTHRSAFDLTARRPLSQHLALWNLNGFDDCFLVDSDNPAGAQTVVPDLKLCAEVFAPRTGRAMAVWSSEPAMQFYTGLNPLAHIGQGPGKEGRFYLQQEGLCFEPQAYPNAPNCPAFPLPLIEPGKPQRGKTVYEFNIF